VRLACPIGLLFLLTFLEHRFYALAYPFGSMAIQPANTVTMVNMSSMSSSVGSWCLESRALLSAHPSIAEAKVHQPIGIFDEHHIHRLLSDEREQLVHTLASFVETRCLFGDHLNHFIATRSRCLL